MGGVRYGRPMGWVPVVDFADQTTAMADIAAACEAVGFFVLTGHGISDITIADAWNTATAFFDRPIGDRMAVAMPYPGYPYGYSPVAGEALAASLGQLGSADLKESFAIGPVDAATHQFEDADEAFAWSPNRWPDEPCAMRAAWERYFREMTGLADRLLATMAQALSMPPNYFSPLINRHTSAMRALRYPGNTEPGDGQMGAGAHTDYGTLTILLADPVQAGLQVQDLQGIWHNVDPLPGGLVVNLGDAMARWTNDRWRSTMHRVLVPRAQRQSIAFFHNANWDAVIECLPTCLADGESATYAPMKAGPHLMHKFRSTVR